MTPECLNCVRLGRCRTVSPEKVRDHYFCDEWSEEPGQEEIQARRDTLEKFGATAIAVMISRYLKEQL